MPDLLKSLGLDVYALTDSDTDEARTFTTYSGYWLALVEHVEREFGMFPYPDLLAELERRSLTNLASKQAACDEDQLRSLLLNAWSSELAMYDVELDNPLKGVKTRFSAHPSFDTLHGRREDLGPIEDSGQLPTRSHARGEVRALQVHVSPARAGWVQVGSGTDPRLRNLRPLHSTPR
jgi:hypothetical protein